MAAFAQIAVHGADKIAKEWNRAAAIADAEAWRITSTYTRLTTTSAKSHASGRPGLRTITGDFRRRITGNVERTAGSVVGVIGTTHPAGRRHELGFHGVDSLGRHYDQP